MPLHDRFRKMLLDARLKAELTQADLAAALSKPQSYVSKYERGERRLDVVEFLEIARALGVKPGPFLENLERSQRR